MSMSDEEIHHLLEGVTNQEIEAYKNTLAILGEAQAKALITGEVDDVYLEMNESIFAHIDLNNLTNVNDFVLALNAGKFDDEINILLYGATQQSIEDYRKILELQVKGASEEEIDNFKLQRIKSMFENVDHDNLTNANEFMRDLNAGKFDKEE